MSFFHVPSDVINSGYAEENQKNATNGKQDGEKDGRDNANDDTDRQKDVGNHAFSPRTWVI